jgi:hypothetical protein
MRKKINLNNFDLTIPNLIENNDLNFNISLKKGSLNIKSITSINQMCSKHSVNVNLHRLYNNLQKVKSLVNFKSQLSNSTDLLQTEISFCNPITLNQNIKIIL